MKRNNGIVLMCTLAAIALTAACVHQENSQQKLKDGKPIEQTFICEDDTTLTEEHVGVRSASPVNNASYNSGVNSSMWRIVYTTGQEAFYNQPFGETCRLVRN